MKGRANSVLNEVAVVHKGENWKGAKVQYVQNRTRGGGSFCQFNEAVLHRLSPRLPTEFCTQRV